MRLTVRAFYSTVYFLKSNKNKKCFSKLRLIRANRSEAIFMNEQPLINKTFLISMLGYTLHNLL
jgi:hypothetical protein